MQRKDTGEFKLRIIDDSVSFSKKRMDITEIRKYICTYFDDPTLEKCQNHYNIGIYKTHVSCSTCDGYKYITVMINEDENSRVALGKKFKLSELKIYIFQIFK